MIIIRILVAISLLVFTLISGVFASDLEKSFNDQNHQTTDEATEHSNQTRYTCSPPTEEEIKHLRLAIDELQTIYSRVNEKDQAAIDLLITADIYKDDIKITAVDAMEAAIYPGNIKVVSHLLKAGVDPAMSSSTTGDTPIGSAACYGRMQMLNEMIDAGGDVNAIDANSNTPLLSAVRRGRVDIVEQLLAEGAEPNYITEYGSTILNSAIEPDEPGKPDSIKIIKMLIDTGADINQGDGFGFTPLKDAVHEENEEAVVLLFLSGADFYKKTEESFFIRQVNPKIDTMVDLMVGHYPLITTHVRDGNFFGVKELLASGVDVNHHAGNGITPLWMAACIGRTKIVEYLLLCDADVNIHDTHFNTTPLWAASRYGHTQIVRLLIEAGADVNVIRSTDGLDPLIMAASRGHAKITRMLLDAGTDVKHTKIDEDVNAVFLASQNGRTKCLAMLLETDAEVNNVRAPDKVTPLHMAAQGGHIDCVGMLIEAGADLNAATDDGNTPLHSAAYDGHYQVGELLVKAGADIELRNHKDYSPLGRAAYYDNYQFAKMLLDNGADVNAKSKKWKTTALYRAAKDGHADIVQLLIERGADVNAVRTNGKTALYIAMFEKHHYIAHQLLNAGADVNVKVKYNGTIMTPLRLAQLQENQDLIYRIKEHAIHNGLQSPN